MEFAGSDAVAAAVVEAVAGQPWEDVLRKRVLEPLGMKDTTFWPTDEQLKRRVGLYVLRKGLSAEPCAHDESMQPPYGDDRVFASAGAGLWTTASDQLKFYKMLMNLGVGDNGVRLLKEETVKSLLAVSSRSPDLKTQDWTKGGYSLGFCAPKVDAEDKWFGHGGAWGTNCSVNWHRKELKLYVVQLIGQPRPWDKAYDDDAVARFFDRGKGEDASAGSTGRLSR
mgnify:CR=1 FL=1